MMDVQEMFSMQDCKEHPRGKLLYEVQDAHKEVTVPFMEVWLIQCNVYVWFREQNRQPFMNPSGVYMQNVEFYWNRAI